MTTAITTKQISWTRIEPEADPTHGKPIARSSHGFSVLRKGTRMILIGGEHVARTPIEASNNVWAADLVVPSGDDDNNNNNINLNNETTQWKWRLVETNNKQGSSSSSPAPRIAHAQAVFDDRIVYIFGGRAGIQMNEHAMNCLWKLDCSGEPGTERWTQVEEGTGGDGAPEARSFHKMICLGNFLYVFGGCSATHGRLADLHRYDIHQNQWTKLTPSSLRGRGGPNLIPLSSGSKVGVIAGFAGEETADGQIYDLNTGEWESSSALLLEEKLQGMRPRSVCVSGSFPSLGYSIIFGGEVDPSDRGHEGAGGFENDVVILNEKTGAYLTSIKPNDDDGDNENDNENASANKWPKIRGWSSAEAIDGGNDGTVGRLFLFGGLTGDDKHPERLDDLWMMEIRGNGS